MSVATNTLMTADFLESSGELVLKRSRFVVLALGFLLLMLITWAALAYVRMSVRADGRVIPTGKSQLVQHLEGGVLHALAVAEGDMVERGAVLARISDVLGSSQLSERKVRMENLRAKIARLQAEAQGVASWAIPSSASSGEGGASIWRVEQEAFQARRQKRLSEESEQSSRREHLLAELELAQKQRDIAQDLLNREAGSKMEYLDAQSRVQRLKTQLAETQSRLGEIGSRYRAEAHTDLTAARSELERLEEESKAGADRVERSELRSPVKGVVNRLYVNTLGGVLKPGEAVMEITPIEDMRLIVEGRVKPADRGDLHAGLPVRIRLSAYDYTVYGALQGVLQEISADTVPDERGERYYRVRVEADHSSAEKMLRQKVVPGMTATLDIHVGERSVLSYLLSPLARFSSNAFSERR